MSIYSLMEKDWKIYCLMSSIVYIEEMTKPTTHIQIKRYKDNVYKCLCFHSISLRMKDPEFVGKFFEITKKWEKEKGLKFIGKSYDKIKRDQRNGQNFFHLSPLWINYIISECGKIPNKYSFDSALKRVRYIKHYKKVSINFKKRLFGLLLKDKRLAAGAFVVSMDLECRGMQQGSVSLCMSKQFSDFLKVMLKIAQRWGWTHNKCLSPVNVENSIRLGINASPQYEFRISIKGLKEIYKLAGPLTNSHKDKCISFHVTRSENYVNSWKIRKKNNTRKKLLNVVENNKDMTTTNLQFLVGVRVDVILDHLHKLERAGKILKERKGKRYIWNIKENAN